MTESDPVENRLLVFVQSDVSAYIPLIAVDSEGAIIGPSVALEAILGPVTERVGTLAEFTERYIPVAQRQMFLDAFRARTEGSWAPAIRGVRFQLGLDHTAPMRWYGMHVMQLGEGFVIRFDDVTREVMLEQQLEQALQPSLEQVFLLDVFNHGNAVCLAPEDGIVQLASPQVALTLAVDPEELLGKPLLTILEAQVQDEDLPKLYRFYEELGFESGEFIAGGNHRLCLIQDDGERWIEISARQVPLGDNRFVLAIEIEDVTRTIILQRMLSAQAHDFRVPLSTIQIALPVFDTHDLSRQRSARGRIAAGIADATRIAEEMLDMLRAERGDLHIRKGEVHIEPIFSHLLAEFMQIAQSEQIRDFSYEVREGFPLLRADGDRILRVLRNLVENALRYSPPNAQVLMYAGRDPRDTSRWILSVLNTGVGIPQEDVRKMGSFGLRLGNSRRDSHGFGIWIARTIVEAHGWEFEVLSRSHADDSAFDEDLVPTDRIAGPGEEKVLIVIRIDPDDLEFSQT